MRFGAGGFVPLSLGWRDGAPFDRPIIDGRAAGLRDGAVPAVETMLVRSFFAAADGAGLADVELPVEDDGEASGSCLAFEAAVGAMRCEVDCNGPEPDVTLQPPDGSGSCFALEDAVGAVR